MCLLVQRHEQGHRSRPVCSWWAGRKPVLRRHQANPRWGTLWKRTCLDSESVKVRGDNQRIRIDPHWIRETHQLSRIYHPGLEPRKAKWYHQGLEADRSHTTSSFGLLHHILRITFIIILVIYCRYLYVGGCTCHGVCLKLVLSFYLWVPGV